MAIFFMTLLRFRILTTPRAWSDLKPRWIPNGNGFNSDRRHLPRFLACLRLFRVTAFLPLVECLVRSIIIIDNNHLCNFVRICCHMLKLLCTIKLEENLLILIFTSHTLLYCTFILAHYFCETYIMIRYNGMQLNINLNIFIEFIAR